MTTPHRTSLVKDPHLPWDGPFPYDHLSARLAQSGARPVGPESTATEIKDSFFDIMGTGQVEHADRVAWDALRRLDERLVVDFFMYEVPTADAESVAADIAACTVPVWLPDFRRIADVAPDFSVLAAPAQIDVGHLPPPIDVPAAEVAAGPIHIGPVPLDLLRLLESEHE